MHTVDTQQLEETMYAVFSNVFYEIYKNSNTQNASTYLLKYIECSYIPP